MGDTLPAFLTAALASTATGYGAVIDGVLNIRTVTETPNMAAVNAAYLKGFHIIATCTDPSCNCIVRALAERCPDVKIVPVLVEVQHG